MKSLGWIGSFAILAVGCGGSADEGEAEAEAESEGEATNCENAIALASGEACEDDRSCICDECSTYCEAVNLHSLPDADITASDGNSFEDEVEADFSCLGKNEPPAAPSGVTMSGIVEDFQTNSPLAAALVEAFASSENFDKACAQATSGEDGSYTIDVPADCLNAAQLSWRVTADDQVPTFHLNQTFSCEGDSCAVEETRISVSESTMDTIPAILGSNPAPGSSIVVGDILDCARNSVQYANGRVFDDQGEAISDVQAYFFKEEFPVRRNVQQWTSLDGLVGLLQVPADGGLVEIRAYGNVSGEETLLSSVRVPPFPDSIIITDMDPLRSAN